jgi:hypothetical protein
MHYHPTTPIGLMRPLFSLRDGHLKDRVSQHAHGENTMRLVPSSPYGEGGEAHELESRMSRLPVLLISMTCLALPLAAGCSSNPNSVSISSIRGNLTPEVKGVSETNYDQANNQAIIENIQWREASDDIDRILLLDQPSTLSPYPFVSTGH